MGKKREKASEESQKNTKTEKKTSRVNPIELMIFLGFVGVFSFSAYRLFFEWNDIEQQITSNGIGQIEAQRSPASRSPYVSFECDSEVNKRELVTQKVIRLEGEICEFDTKGSPPRTQVVHLETKVQATIFPDMDRGTFLTDDIHLAPGINTISLKFKYLNRDEIIKKIQITRK